MSAKRRVQRVAKRRPRPAQTQRQPRSLDGAAFDLSRETYLTVRQTMHYVGTVNDREGQSRLTDLLAASVDEAHVRWATSKQQANNWATRNRRISFGGQTMLLSEWAQQLGLTRESLRDRLDSGWPIEKAVTLPAIRKRTRTSAGRFAHV